MKTWNVTLPVSGTVTVQVEADTEESAIAAALNSDKIPEVPDEWECHHHLVRGNVCYASTHEAEATEAGNPVQDPALRKLINQLCNLLKECGVGRYPRAPGAEGTR